MNHEPDEFLDLVDENDKVIGRKKRSEVYTEKLSNFRVVNAFVVNSKDEIWIPRRTANKRMFPLYLDMSMGGHVESGESYENAFKRETMEELNIDTGKAQTRLLGHLSPQKDGVSANMNVYEIKTDETPNYNHNDFTEHFWLTPQALFERIANGEKTKGDLPKLVRIFYWLDPKEFDKFIGKANKTYQQFCIWFNANNEFSKHQDRWNSIISKGGCKYKNFWEVIIASVQHTWILGVARLLDTAYASFDKNKKKPRLSLEYILQKLNNHNLTTKIHNELLEFQSFSNSIKKHRINVLAHNDINFEPSKIEAGVEDFFEWLEDSISEIKKYPHLAACKTINLKHTEELSKNGVKEVFENILAGEN
ncbi:MAG: NUDIX hydrolase [Parcubacteria group bacterium]|nr:NUDIX hydrolase [Parcubacteria group bacterium]